MNAPTSDMYAALGAVLALQPHRPEYKSPIGIGADADKLLRLARGCAGRAVQLCNVGKLSPRQEAMERAAEKKLHAIAAEYGATVKTGGDPRGYVVRLVLATGDSNSLGGDWGLW